MLIKYIFVLCFFNFFLSILVYIFGFIGINGFLKYVENVGIGFFIFNFVFVNFVVNLVIKWYIVVFWFSFEIGGNILKEFVVKNIIIFGILFIFDNLVLGI